MKKLSNSRLLEPKIFRRNRKQEASVVFLCNCIYTSECKKILGPEIQHKKRISGSTYSRFTITPPEFESDVIKANIISKLRGFYYFQSRDFSLNRRFN